MTNINISSNYGKKVTSIYVNDILIMQVYMQKSRFVAYLHQDAKSLVPVLKTASNIQKNPHYTAERIAKGEKYSHLFTTKVTDKCNTMQAFTDRVAKVIAPALATAEEA